MATHSSIDMGRKSGTEEVEWQGRGEWWAREAFCTQLLHTSSALSPLSFQEERAAEIAAGATLSKGIGGTRMLPQP